jgi:hypothetical protein
MDKITFESVMEEIKKSLGEARLMKIGEESVADTQAKIQNDIDARNAARDATNRQKVDDADAATTPARGTSTPAPAPAPAAAPTATPSIPSTTARMAPGAMTGGSFKPEGPKPAPAPAPSVRSGVGDGSLGFGMKGPESFGKSVAPSAPKPPAPKPVEPAKSVSDEPSGGGIASPSGATRMAPPKGAAPAPKSQGITNQPAKPYSSVPIPKATAPTTPPDGNKYGFKDSGSDDDTASNFFAADKRMMADRAAQTAPKSVAPKPAAPKRAAPLTPRRPATREAGAVGGSNIAENFDQFVKKFLKESK